VTAQVNLPGKHHAHWLFNVKEIVALVVSLGYQLAFRGAVDGRINQDRFKYNHHFYQSCNLLFGKYERVAIM